MELFIEVFGWIGAGLLLLAFYFNTRQIYPATSKESLAINIIGGTGLLLNGAYHGALPSVALNGVWIVVGVSALIKIMGNKDR